MNAQELLQEARVTCALDADLAPFSRVGSLPERIGDRLIMAPMAGVSDAAWRMLARAGGAAYAYTEMVSVAGLHYKSDKTWELLIPKEPEPDVAVQLFGSVPEQFREAAAAVVGRLGERLILIDVNMACPVPKVTRSGAGSALMETPDIAQDIIRATLAGVEDAHACVPVTAKIRRGYQMGQESAPDFARALDEAGVAAIAVHGRFAKQFYRDQADWSSIKRVVEATSVPVIGSGDVYAHEDAGRMRAETGCAAVMVARGSYGNPWIFKGMVPTPRQRVNGFATHVRLLEATGAHMARARSLAGFYLKGMPHAAALRQEAMTCNTTKDYLDLAERVLERVGLLDA